MTPILLALAYRAMEQGEWWVALPIAVLGVMSSYSDPRV
jgi:hypothetical protein